MTAYDAPTVQEREVFKGILYKKGKVNKAWKKRFFVLLNSRKLQYYKSKQSYDNNEKCINFIPLQYVQSIAPVHIISDTLQKHVSVEKQMKKQKSKKKKQWSIDFKFLSPKSSADDDDSDDEDDDYIHFIELVLNQQFTFEMVTKKRRYLMCTNEAIFFNQWITELEAITFGKKLFKGWLHKRGEGVKNWKKRWFVIFDTKEMRYYVDQQRAEPKGSIFINNIITMVKCDEYMQRKKYKKNAGCILELNLPDRTWVLQCNDYEERQSWFTQIVSIMANVHFLVPIFQDLLFVYDDNAQAWKEKYFAVDEKSLFQFNTEQDFDEYQKVAYFDEKEYNLNYSRYVQLRIPLFPFTTKTVQKIRPGSSLSRRLNKENIFIINNAIGKFFFSTRKETQLNRWFKNLRKLGSGPGAGAGAGAGTEKIAKHVAKHVAKHNQNKNKNQSPNHNRNTRQQTPDTPNTAGSIDDEKEAKIDEHHSQLNGRKNKHRNTQGKSGGGGGGGGTQKLTTLALLEHDSEVAHNREEDGMDVDVDDDDNDGGILERLQELQREMKLCASDIGYIRGRWEIENDVNGNQNGNQNTRKTTKSIHQARKNSSSDQEIAYDYSSHKQLKLNERNRDQKQIDRERSQHSLHNLRNKKQSQANKNNNNKKKSKHRKRSVSDTYSSDTDDESWD